MCSCKYCMKTNMNSYVKKYACLKYQRPYLSNGKLITVLIELTPESIFSSFKCWQLVGKIFFIFNTITLFYVSGKSRKT